MDWRRDCPSVRWIRSRRLSLEPTRVRNYRVNGQDLSREQREVLGEAGDLLVVGKAGCGKTSIALLKALKFIEEVADPSGHVLFLSFSNAAVQRIQNAAQVVVPRSAASALQVTTFHAFCFGILHSHARLVGMPRLGQVILPHERRMIVAEHGGATDGLAVMERQEGRVSFERFVPLILTLFKRHPVLRAAYAAAYPLVIVDEYQDTNDEQDELVDLLGMPGQVVYLGDPDQRVYDFVPGVRADRFDLLLARKKTVRRIDLPTMSHRSGASDLVVYGRAVLSGAGLSARPRDVFVHYHGKAADFKRKLRVAIVGAEDAARKRSAGKVARPATAVLAYTNAFAIRLSEDLRTDAPGFDRPFAHVLHVDIPDLVPAWALALALLECPGDAESLQVTAAALHEFARYEASQRTQGRQQRGAVLRETAEALRHGTKISARSLKDLPARVGGLARSLSGEPRADIERVLAMLSSAGGNFFDDVARTLNLRSPATCGPLVSQLSEAFAQHGHYKGARRLGEGYLAGEHLWQTELGTVGRVVTTLHKTKGKEFDAVVIVDGSTGDRLVQRDDPGFAKSRRLLSMAIARARYYVAIVTPVYDPCPLLPDYPRRNVAPETPTRHST